MRHDQKKIQVWVNKNRFLEFDPTDFAKFINDVDGERLRVHQHNLANMLFTCIEKVQLNDFDKIKDYTYSIKSIYNLIDLYAELNAVQITDMD